jgi:hypothetical protein
VGLFSRASLLIIYVCAAFGIFFGVLSIIISCFILSLYVGLIGIYGVVYGIIKIYSLRKDGRVDKEREKNIAFRVAACAFGMTFIVFSFTVVVSFFHFIDNFKFDNIMFLYYFVWLAFWNTLIAVFEFFRTIRTKSAILRNVKLIDLAHSLITIGLAIRITRLHMGYSYADTVANFFNFIFAILAFSICAVMFLNSRLSKSPQSL